MTRRLPTAQRREQIILAALGLLEDHPVDQVTTRKIADVVGVSQPALFRHFDSREAILTAVVSRSRDALRRSAELELQSRTDWATTASSIGDVLLQHIQAHPGLARLLFHNLSNRGQSAAHRPLRGLTEMQAGLVTRLVQDGQQDGLVPEIVDAHQAGELFVAALQGAILYGMLGPNPNIRLAQNAIRLWVEGVRNGIPERSTPPAAAVCKQALVQLDVRPMLAAGNEPFDPIVEALGRTSDQGLLLLTAPFRPGPLLQMLTGRGYTVEAVERGAKHWEIEARGPNCPQPLDLRDLESPEPLEAILMATGRLAENAVVVARVPQTPRLLLPHLHQRGLVWQLQDRADGTVVIHIEHAP